MQAWFCETLTGPDGLLWKDVPTPEPGAGEVRIAIRAASLNFPDILIVQGKYQFKPALPFVPGSEYSGVVEALGDGVTNLKVGDAVAAMGSTGGFATHALAAAKQVLVQRVREVERGKIFDEYKGRTPIVRSGKTYPVRETDFDNAVPRGGWEFSTGGSSGRRSRMLMELDFLADRSPYEQIMLRLLDIERVPLAVWYPKLPASIGLTACLRYAKVGKPADRWFDMTLAGRAMPAWHSWALSAIVGVSRLAGAPVPSPVAAPIDAPGIILDWIVESVAQHRRCALQCNVSSVVRLCRAATARGIDLRGVQFLTGSEPLTPARHAEIVATGARVFLRYFAIDLGSIGAGCGAPDGADEVHLLSDNVALVSSGAVLLLRASNRSFSESRIAMSRAGRPIAAASKNPGSLISPSTTRLNSSVRFGLRFFR